MAAVSLCVNGIFAADPAFAYTGGNRVYVSEPLSLLASLPVLLITVSAMKKTGSEDLAALFRRAGRGFSLLLALPVCASLLICAALPLFEIAQVLERQVYDGAGFLSILAFIIPVTAYIALKGAECVGRTAKCIVLLLAGALAVSVASAVRGFDASRLFPAPYGSAAALPAAWSHAFTFIPPLLALTVFGTALQGADYVRYSGVRAAIIAAFVCFAAQLAVSLCFTDDALEGLLAPIFRMGMLTPKQSFILRLDKLFIMIWLMGAMVSGAYCIYACSLLITKTAGLKSVVPASAADCVIVFALLLAGVETRQPALDRARRMLSEYGAAAVLLPLLTALSAALAGERRRERKRRASA